ncbi:MAG TPA: Gfo/Idh/MocA family oxidoreductase, partial [Tepidisphaeraceae bacterium]|nr:Gfo/Idh/MocA family oxidoreductase [Tepidisphaeraceae bacterium]
ERLAKAREQFGDRVRVFEHVDAMLDAGGVDAVFVATPHYDHPPLATRALERGLHVLVEKPAGVYTKQVRAMNEAARRSGRVFGVMYNQRTIPAHRRMRQLVQGGELGEVRRVLYQITDWLRTQSYYDSGGWRGTWSGEGGGVLMNQSPHNLDLWQWICGMPARVRAFCRFGQYHNVEIEDDVTAYAEYPNGATGVFITTTGEAPGTKQLEVTGDRGRAVLSGNTITFWRTAVPVPEYIRTDPRPMTMPPTEKIEITPDGVAEDHEGITRDWVRAIRTGSPLLAPGEEGIAAVELANAMLLSTWTDNWVNVPIDDDLYERELRRRAEQSTFRKPEQRAGAALDFSGTF